jgi:hypothetical protein
VSRNYVQIRHTASDTLIAEGPLGWGITPFEGNYYIRKKGVKKGVRALFLEQRYSENRHEEKGSDPFFPR